MTETRNTVVDDQLGQITEEQWEIFRRFKEGTLPFSLLELSLQNLIDGKLEVGGPHFEMIDAGMLIVPANYVGKKQLSTIDFSNFVSCSNKGIKDKNYKNVSRHMQPHEKFIVKVFRVKKSYKREIAQEKCVEFIERQKGVHLGAQGALLIWQQAKSLFPKEAYTYSFDRRENLWKCGAFDEYFTPLMERRTRARKGKDMWNFGAIPFSAKLSSGDCFFVICEC